MIYRMNKYEQLEDDIVSDIKSGKLKPGDKVDSESVLKKKYNISATTVRKAFADLINAGYLVGKQGAGTFVARKQMIRALTSISFSEELKEQGYRVGMRVDSIGYEINENAAEELGLSGVTDLLCLRRVRLANDEPVAYHISWFPPDLLTRKQIEEVRKSNSLYDTMKKHGIVPAVVNENYSVREITDSMICKQLAVKRNYPSFFVKRTTFDAENNVIEYAETYFNKEWYSVTVNIKA